MTDREDICRQLGIKGPAELHQLVVGGIQTGPGPLLAKGLNSTRLRLLGYTAENLQRLGLTAHTVKALGFEVKLPEVAAPAAGEPSAGVSLNLAPGEDMPEGTALQLRAEVAAGKSALTFRAEGVTVHHLKRAGNSAQELVRIGFSLDDLASVCRAPELRRAGFGVQNLRRYFPGSELRTAGFDAMDMRNAGFGIKDLRNAGFNDNQIRIAGYSVVELQREGLSKQTVVK